MHRIRIVVAALAIAGIAGSSASSGDDAAPGAPPVYRLDARFHKMPPELVARLLAHPPARGWLDLNYRCETTSRERNERGYQSGYCICFADTCRVGADFIYDHDFVWKCVGPFGFVGTEGLAVCAADLMGEQVTVG